MAKKNQGIKFCRGCLYIRTFCNINGTWRSVNSIKTIIGGVTKTVIEPKVNINGVWKDKNYTINIYNNKTVYRTLTCTKGDSITLPNITDGAGYATSTTSTNSVYNNGATIKPTDNISLYVLKYVYNYTSKSITSGGFFAPFNQSITITFNGGTTSVINGGVTYHQTTTLNTVARPPYVKIGSTFLTGSYSKGQSITQNVSENQYVTLGTYFNDTVFIYDFNITVQYQTRSTSGVVNTNA